MIIKKDERKMVSVESLKGGDGSVIKTTIADETTTFNHAKMYANLTLKKDCGIGHHNHIDETEVILVNSGVASYNDDGQICEALPGDVLVCEDGHFHSIKNTKDEDLIITALVIKK